MREKLIESAIRYLIKNKPKNLAGLDSLKRKIAKRFNLPTLSNVELLKAYHKFLKNQKSTLRLRSGLMVSRAESSKFKSQKLETLLKKRKIRSLSGIVVVSVLTKPYPCPGKCLYCPTQKGMPKSYLDNEPAVMRAILNHFDPYSQVRNRLEALYMTGHPTDKVELIIIGGTWSYLPKKYQEWFIIQCFRACNEFGKKSKVKNQKSKLHIKNQKLASEQKKNEKAKHRIIGITVETRPDFIDEEEIINLRKLGVTRVELGVQSIYDDVLKFNHRGHNVEATIKATRLLKDAGFKICYHLMPNLPGSSLKRDEKIFEEIFKNPDFQPDLLKIYPCAILKEANIYKLWKAKKYKPYTEKQLVNLLLKAKKQIPYYCRIQRLVRDIPSKSIIAGPAKISNLRQVLAKEMVKAGWRCKCIRCREVKDDYDPKEKLYLYRQDYLASDGKEVFLSYENKTRNRLYSLLRLRIPNIINETRPRCVLSILKDAVIIREIHTYGQLHPLGDNGQEQFLTKSPQHKGLGKKLIKEAERIAREEFGVHPVKSRGAGIPLGSPSGTGLFNRVKKIAVISGVGARDYYRKLGYKLKDTYMIKTL